jgi:N-terminal domain of Peptidase_S41 in eukaryotic IRBP
MSEKIYAWLLRLYPSRFRAAYGKDALQLFRDRSRDERGLLPHVRLWLDLLADIAVSLPREHRRGQPALIAASVHRSDGIPSFHVLEDEQLRFAALFWGGVLAFAILSAFLLLIDHVGDPRPPRASIARSLPQNDAAPSPSVYPADRVSDDGKETMRASASSTPDTNSFSRNRAAQNDLLSKPLLLSGGSAPQQAQGPQPKPQDSTSAMMNATERQRVIDGLIANLKAYYIDPEVARKVTDTLRAHQESGDYDTVTDGAAFADLLTGQMRDASHDVRLILVYSPNKLPEQQGPAAESLAHSTLFHRIDDHFGLGIPEARARRE